MSTTTGTAKVVSVTDTGKSWKDFKKIAVVLDNGVEGVANAKNFPPPYKEGDDVEYEANENQYGVLLKVKKADTGGFSSPAPANSWNAASKPDNRGKEIQVGQSVNLAVETLASGVWVEGFDAEKYITQVEYMAKEYYALLDKLKKDLA